MTPATETVGPTHAELARFAHTFGLEGSPHVREHFERHQARRAQWRPSDGELRQAGEVIAQHVAEGGSLDGGAERALERCNIAYPEGMERHDAAQRLVLYVEKRGYLKIETPARPLSELESRWRDLAPRVAGGDKVAKRELTVIEAAMRQAYVAQGAAESEREAAEMAEREGREKAQARAEKLAPRIDAAKALADERLAAAAQAVVDLHALQGEQSDALRVSGAPSGLVEGARPRPHRVIEAWTWALRVAGLPVRGAAQPFSDSAKPL